MLLPTRLSCSPGQGWDDLKFPCGIGLVQERKVNRPLWTFYLAWLEVPQDLALVALPNPFFKPAVQ